MSCLGDWNCTITLPIVGTFQKERNHAQLISTNILHSGHYSSILKRNNQIQNYE